MVREPGRIRRRWQERRAVAAASRAAASDDELENLQNLEDRRAERVVQQLAQRWESGPSNVTRAEVPWAYDVAAAWSWRFLVITAAAGLVFAGLSYLSVLVFPVVIALFIAALVAPIVTGLQYLGLSRQLASLLVVIGGIALVVLLLTFVGQQVATSVDQLSEKVVGGLDEIRNWLRTGPLHASDSQINDWIGRAQDFVQTQGKDVVGRVTEVGVAVGHIVAGFFIVLFATYFFLADGELIWSWVVRLFPRAARSRADSSGKVAWESMTKFVRATMLVAGTDALGVMIFAAVLKVPLVSAIGVLVFLGAFIPLVGAFASGTVAVLVALVAHGPIVALVMLGGVVLVQQVEAHVLQPFLMGRFVSVHPLGVILAIAAGVIVAGVAGALVAVPLVAALNAVVQHLASYVEPEAVAVPDLVAEPAGDPE